MFRPFFGTSPAIVGQSGDDFPISVMVICDVFYSHFSAVPMFKISVRKLRASLGRFFLMSSWRPWAY